MASIEQGSGGLIVIECECGARTPYITPHAADCPETDDWYWSGEGPEPPERVAARQERQKREREVVYVPQEDHEASFVQACLDTLDGQQPIIYLHRLESAPADAVLVDAAMWEKIMRLIPEGTGITGLVMQHEHVWAEE